MPNFIQAPVYSISPMYGIQPPLMVRLQGRGGPALFVPLYNRTLTGGF